MKLNSSKSTLNSPVKSGNKFPKAERVCPLIGYQNPKVGPGTYLKDMYPNANRNFERSIMGGTQLSDISTFGRTDRKLHPQTEKARRRKFTTKFVENMRKGRKKVSSITANFEDSSDSEDGYINVPGPGSYCVPSENGATAKSDISPFQYFGSTSPRFAPSDVNKVPGPGTYKERVDIPKHATSGTS